MTILLDLTSLPLTVLVMLYPLPKVLEPFAIPLPPFACQRRLSGASLAWTVDANLDLVPSKQEWRCNVMLEGHTLTLQLRIRLVHYP